MFADEAMQTTKKVFITGGNGFIGQKLIEKLLKRRFTIRALVRQKKESTDKIEYVHGDVTDIDSLRRGMEGCRYVFHLAAYAKNWAPDRNTFDRINIGGTTNVFSVAKELGIERIVWTSSIVTFGPTKPDVLGNETMPRITDKFYTDYERSKFEMEQKSVQWIKDGLPLVIVNPTRVFGPGQLSESNMVTQLIDMYRKGQVPILFNLGKNIGNYALVDDVAEGHILAMEKGKIGEKYILGGDNASLKELFQTIDRIDGKKRFQLPIFWLCPMLIAYILQTGANLFGFYPVFTPGWIRTFLADWVYTPEKACREIGYSCISFEEAIRETCCWLDELSQKQAEQLIEV